MNKKSFLFISFIFLLATDVSGANRTDTLPLADSAGTDLMYKKKAKTSLVTGVILSSAGVVAAGIGTGLTLAGLGHLFEPVTRVKTMEVFLPYWGTVDWH